MTLASKRLYLIFALLMTLAGCTTVQTPVTQVNWQAHQTKLEQLDQYRLSGKLGYISPQQRQSMNFQWIKSPDKTDLRLTNFLGQTVLHLTVDSHGAKVETYDDKVFTDPNPEVLITRLTGLVLPLKSLQDWIVGLPSNADDYILNTNNTLASLVKTLGGQRWLVTYTDYGEYPKGKETLPLPTKLKLVQNQTKLHIVITKWTLPQ